MHRRLHVLSCCLVFLIPCISARAAAPDPVMNKPGKLVLDEPMSKQPGTGWKVSKGKWEMKNDAWVASVIPKENHGPTIRHALPASDCIIEMQVKFAELKNVHISFNDDKGHVSRVMLMPSGLIVRKDSYEHKNDEDLKKVPMKSEPGKWHTLLIETRGDEMVAHLDDTVSYGKHPDIAKKKSEIALGFGGDGVEARNMKIWEGEANPEWAKAREKIAAKK